MASSSSAFCGTMTMPTRQLTIVSAPMSLSIGARSSPWKVGTDATTSLADLASARLRFLGAKLAKSCSSMFITNCKRASNRMPSYAADDPHRPGIPSVCTA